MTTQDAQRLLQRYLAGECTAEEKELLEAWWAELQEEFEWEVPAGQENAVHHRILSGIKAELRGELEVAMGERVPEMEADGEGPRAPVRRIEWRRYAGIAAAVLVIAAGGWLWSSRHRAQPVDDSPITIEANPGGDRALLTLGNGRQVVLDSAANGMLAIQGNDRVIKQNGQLDYQRNGKGDETAENTVLMNTLAIPRGGQYKLILADGTKVWLDAASSITYPTAFVGKTRQVSISGQAYFEVVHNPNMPFEVKVQGQTIRDIGTAFNINAYEDEPTMKVTLVSGAIAVGGPGSMVELRQAGQQAEYKDGQQTPVHDTDLTSVLAWKNGLFYLTSADIATVMRQVGRWYDVDILFEKGIPAGHITGEVPRNTMLSTALQVLRTSGIHFMVEGKTIHVMP
jgi:ferric-dicitrate binding protein FerR (iron transport regulator)